MSNTEELKKYLIDAENGFLVNPHNNGKTIMLSGAWGSGKTHFWKEKIELKLSENLKENDKACVSLYGKDNLESLKNEILFKAYESIKDENKVAKRAISVFGFGSRLLSVSVGGVRANTSAVGDVVEGFFESKKIDKAESFIVDGGIICLDDFERKSKHIDLNDLFGFISQLAIDMNCKVVIILNSDVFKGEEANIFKTVKEKTVNKYFYFEPTIKELFYSIADDEKYKALDNYKAQILEAIEETEELNARIYMQVLDNIEEWIVPNQSSVGDGDILRYFVLVNINFILTHHIIDAELIQVDKNRLKSLGGESIHTADYEDRISIKVKNSGLEYEKIDKYIREPYTYNENFIENLKQTIKDDQKSESAKSGGYDNSEALIEFIDHNQSFVKSLHFMYTLKLDRYGHSHNKAEVEILNNINRFIETGIL